MEWIGTAAVVALALGAWGMIQQARKPRDVLSRAVDAFRLGDGEEGEALWAQLKPTLRGVTDRLRAAERLMDARAYAHALELTEEALELKPEARRLVRLQALLHARLQRPDARELLEAWLKTHPRDDEALMELGELLLALRQHEALARWLAPYAKRHRDAVRVRSLLGRSAFFAGQLDDAARYLSQAQRSRDKQRRSVVTLYDNNMESGYDFRYAAEGQWEERHDAILLEQIRSGQATSAVASVYEADRDA